MITDKRLTNYLFIVEGVGAVFVGVFLAAYLGGLFYTPQTTVLHSDWTWTFRIPLFIFGGIFAELALVAIVLAALNKN
ncbi:MAG: hypothetical protein ABSA79_08230 [Candidatus Bathyarchaeia archaeon]|jgi:hypothetical protein